MAVTIHRRDVNHVGSTKEEYLRVSSDDGDAIVRTRLSWIDSIQASAIKTQDLVFELYPNSITASATEDDPGAFFVTGLATDEQYVFYVVGR